MHLGFMNFVLIFLIKKTRENAIVDAIDIKYPLLS